MIDRIATLWPEIALLVGACLCMVIGLSASPGWRKAPVWVAAGSLGLAGYCVLHAPSHGVASLAGGSQAPWLDLGLPGFVKLAIVGVGLLLLLVAVQVPEHLPQTIDAEASAASGKPFDPSEMMRGEFFAFFLFSLAGAMLCAGADDLVWLFLSLELTSLPTYVMVAITRDRAQAQEAAVKYFFLGAMAAAVFLYGFTLIYGATGFTQYPQIASYIHAQASSPTGLPPLLVTGIVLAVVGISFKIAAVPMHFYTADVYQGAAIPVTAFLAFVPKTAGFVALIGLLGLVGHANPDQIQPIVWLIWGMAVLSMTVGNVLGLLQNNVKRVLAYSSIAHSGYMLVGLVAALAAAGDPNAVDPSQHLGNGVAALLFYLVAYGLATLGAFAVLGCLTHRGEEAQTFDDIAGLGRRHPLLGVIMLVSVLSLVGLPPMIGFLGKIYLFGSAIQYGYIGLVVIAVLNSAVSAVYYLRIIGACYFSEPNDDTQQANAMGTRRLGAAIAALGAVALGVAGSQLVDAAHNAAVHSETAIQASAPDWDTHWSDTSITW